MNRPTIHDKQLDAHFGPVGCDEHVVWDAPCDDHTDVDPGCRNCGPRGKPEAECRFCAANREATEEHIDSVRRATARAMRRNR